MKKDIEISIKRLCKLLNLSNITIEDYPTCGGMLLTKIDEKTGGIYLITKRRRKTKEFLSCLEFMIEVLENKDFEWR